VRSAMALGTDVDVIAVAHGGIDVPAGARRAG
jgi:hypothetical protein